MLLNPSRVIARTVSSGGLKAQLAPAGRLFQQGKVSLGPAATIAAKSKRAFIDHLGREGVPVVNYPLDELRGEMRG